MKDFSIEKLTVQERDRLLRVAKAAKLKRQSQINAITRDEDHYLEFIIRHQNKLVYGSDCSEATGRRPECVGANILAAIRRPGRTSRNAAPSEDSGTFVE